MTRARSIRAIASALAVAGLAGACGLLNPGDDNVTANSTPPPSVTYDATGFHVGDVTLGQFPGYERDTQFTAPVGWPVLAQLAIISKAEPFTQPEASGAVLKPGVLETSIKGPDRECFYRIRIGHMDGRDDKPEAVLGTIIATPTGDRPAIGITVERGLERPEESAPVEQLTREIAEQICKPA